MRAPSITVTPWRAVRNGTLIVAVALAGTLGMGDAAAATRTGSLALTASVAANCVISTTALDFGTYDPLSMHRTAPLDNDGAAVVQCTKNHVATIRLGQGLHPNTGSTDAAPLRRLFRGGGGFLQELDYYLYRDAGRTQAWGNTPATAASHTATGATASLPIYGRVPGGQIGLFGVYTDTVVATILF